LKDFVSSETGLIYLIEKKMLQAKIFMEYFGNIDMLFGDW
jgi:hypothetical protein